MTGWNKLPENEKMELITIHIPKEWILVIESLIEKRFAPDRSEFIRYCIYNEIALRLYQPLNFEMVNKPSERKGSHYANNQFLRT